MPERIGNPPLPFERLAQHFNQIPQSSPDRRRMNLADKTTFFIDTKREIPSGPIDACTFSCRARWAKALHSESEFQIVEFTVSKHGLDSILIPNQEFRVGDTIVSQHSSMRLKITAINEDRQKVAHTLIDWVDKIMKENRYTPPPFSLSMSNNFQ